MNALDRAVERESQQGMRVLVELSGLVRCSVAQERREKMCAWQTCSDRGERTAVLCGQWVDRVVYYRKGAVLLGRLRRP